MNALAVLMLWGFGIKESLKFYLARGRYEEGNIELERISRINGFDLDKVAEIIRKISLLERQEISDKAKTLRDSEVSSNKWTNVFLMVTCWTASCYSYFMFVFLIKYLPADIYVVDIASGMASFGFLLQIYLIDKFNHKQTQFLSYLMCTIFLVVLTVAGQQLNLWVYAFIILNLKLFICLSFGTIYVVHLELFDSSFLGTSYGICNVLSRLAIITAPWVAEMETTTVPLLILLGLNAVAMICTAFLKPKGGHE